MYLSGLACARGGFLASMRRCLFDALDRPFLDLIFVLMQALQYGILHRQSVLESRRSTHAEHKYPHALSPSTHRCFIDELHHSRPLLLTELFGELRSSPLQSSPAGIRSTCTTCKTVLRAWMVIPNYKPAPRERNEWSSGCSSLHRDGLGLMPSPCIQEA